MEVKTKFVTSHARDAKFEPGLRGFFEYRDLGIAEATGGRVGAHVIRARGAMDEPSERHHHDVEFQMVYVLRGWIKFDYQGQGEVLLEPGSAVIQPPGIRHSELGHSADLELLEIILPADFATHLDP